MTKELIAYQIITMLLEKANAVDVFFSEEQRDAMMNKFDGMSLTIQVSDDGVRVRIVPTGDAIPMDDITKPVAVKMH